MMVRLSSTEELLGAMKAAHEISMTAYVLPEGRVLDGLLDAAERGARVHLRLEGKTHDPVAANKHVVDELSAAGADARLVHLKNGDGRMLHMKSAIVDDVVYLDDRNWPDDGQDTIVRDAYASDVNAVAKAAEIPGIPGTGVFAVHKDEALRDEARLLYEADEGDDVIVESESFGFWNPAYSALKRAAMNGAHVRLLVAQRDLRENTMEARALSELARFNVDVRTCDSDEKFAVVNGRHGWIGSSNLSAVSKNVNQMDWGMRTNDETILRHVRTAFDQRWNSARAFSSVAASTEAASIPSTSATLSRVNAT